MKEKEYNITGLEALGRSRVDAPFQIRGSMRWFRVTGDGLWKSDNFGEVWRDASDWLSLICATSEARMVDRSEWFDYEPEPEYELPESLSIESLYAMQDGKRSLGQEYHELARRILIQARKDAKSLIEKANK